MKHDHYTFDNIADIEPPKYLKEAIFKSIETAQAKEKQKRNIFLLFGFISSGLAFFASFEIFGKELFYSEFWSIALLGITDIRTVAIFWHEFSLSLLETFPVIAVVCTLIPIFCLLLLLKNYAKPAPELNLNYKR